MARSYLKFDVTKFAGKHITDTNLALYSYYSSTCSTSGAGTQVRRITSSWSSSDVTWAVQPSTTTTGAVTSTAAKGYSSTDCPGGTVNFDIDAIVQAWASGSANYGLQVRGADEADSSTWRRFRSANYVSGDNSVEPHLTVTYNSYATTGSLALSPSSVNAYSGKRYVTTYTPTLSAKVTDADGSTVKAQFAAVRELTALARSKGIAVTQLALAWLLAQGDDIVPIPGTRSPQRLEENMAAAQVTLTSEDLARVQEILPHGSAGSRYPAAMMRTWQ